MQMLMSVRRDFIVAKTTRDALTKRVAMFVSVRPVIKLTGNEAHAKVRTPITFFFYCMF